MKDEATTDVVTEQVSDGPCQWESGQLGRDGGHVEKASVEFGKDIDAAVEMQMISIRFHKDLLEQLKHIANYRRIGYQPMIRDVLGRWARTEINTIFEEIQSEKASKAAMDDAIANRPKPTVPAPDARQKKRAAS